MKPPITPIVSITRTVGGMSGVVKAIWLIRPIRKEPVTLTARVP